eukprot:Amastigsp_a521071_73.p2 type:complete len:125 gc:universal Amastigsp_a521071_73:470-844(+)
MLARHIFCCDQDANGRRINERLVLRRLCQLAHEGSDDFARVLDNGDERVGEHEQKPRGRLAVLRRRMLAEKVLKQRLQVAFLLQILCCGADKSYSAHERRLVVRLGLFADRKQRHAGLSVFSHF